MGLRLSFRPRKAVNTFFHEVPRNEKPFLATAQARQGGVEAPYRRRGSITDTRRSNHQLGGAVAMGGSTTRSILGSLKASVRPRLFRAARHMSPQTPTSCSLHKHCSPHSLPPCNSSTPVRLVVTRYLQYIHRRPVVRSYRCKIPVVTTSERPAATSSSSPSLRSQSWIDHTSQCCFSDRFL